MGLFSASIHFLVFICGGFGFGLRLHCSTSNYICQRGSLVALGGRSVDAPLAGAGTPTRSATDPTPECVTANA